MICRSRCEMVLGRPNLTTNRSARLRATKKQEERSIRRPPTDGIAAAASAYLYCDVLVLLSKNDFVALFASSSLNGDFYVANFYIVVVVVDYSALSFVVSSKEHIHACTLRLQSTYFTSSMSFRIT